MIKLKSLDDWSGALLGIVLILAAWRGWLPYSLIETLGFITGAACVYLVVKQNIWNFPLGIANNIFFLILFAQDRLYGDAGLQIVYIALAMQGWHWWLHGGEHRTALQVNHAPLRLLLIDVRVMLIDDTLDPDDSQLWAEHSIRWLGFAPDLVFSSEDYGDRFARYLGGQHIQVDKARQAVPMSGTQVRADPLAC